MTKPETAGIFISGYSRVERQSIADYRIDFEAKHDLPNQTDMWGCGSATGAFIINQLRNESVTAAELDVAMGREPGKPGDSSKLSIEFVRRGLSVDVHEPVNPIDELGNKLALGEVSDGDFIQLYEGIVGSLKDDERQSLLDYYIRTYIPSKNALGSRFRKYKESGQMTVSKCDGISPDLIASLVNKGQYIFATQYDGSVSGAHAVAIFRPDPLKPAFIFRPAMEDLSTQSGSDIIAYNEEQHELILNARGAIGSIALWNSGLRPSSDASANPAQ